jgi:hypothetical protein
LGTLANDRKQGMLKNREIKKYILDGPRVTSIDLKRGRWKWANVNTVRYPTDSVCMESELL